MVSATPVCQLWGRASSGRLRSPDTTGSPIAPSARLESVTPSWIDEMKRGGASSSRSTLRADLLPWASSSCRRVRRTVTRPYSAATKKPFAATISTTANSSSAVVIVYSDRRRSSPAKYSRGVTGTIGRKRTLKLGPCLPIIAAGKAREPAKTACSRSTVLTAARSSADTGFIRVGVLRRVEHMWLSP